MVQFKSGIIQLYLKDYLDIYERWKVRWNLSAAYFRGCKFDFVRSWIFYPEEKWFPKVDWNGPYEFGANRLKGAEFGLGKK